MKRTLFTAFTALIASAGLVLSACGGGGDQGEQPQPRPPADCNAKPEACK